MFKFKGSNHWRIQDLNLEGREFFVNILTTLIFSHHSLAKRA